MGGDSWPKLGAFLGDWTSDVLTLHLTLVVDDNASVVLEVEEVTLSTADGLTLTDDDSWHNLLSELWLTLLDGGEEHIANGTSWKTRHSWTNASAGNHIQVLSTSVVSTVHNGCNRQTIGDLQLDTRSASLTSLAHIDRLC